MNTIWEILGIEPTLDKKEIRKAYATLSRTYHMEEFPEEFARIQQAYHAALEYAQYQRNKAAQFMHVVTSDNIESGKIVHQTLFYCVWNSFVRIKKLHLLHITARK